MSKYFGITKPIINLPLPFCFATFLCAVENNSEKAARKERRDGMWLRVSLWRRSRRGSLLLGICLCSLLAGHVNVRICGHAYVHAFPTSDIFVATPGPFCRLEASAWPLLPLLQLKGTAVIYFSSIAVVLKWPSKYLCNSLLLISTPWTSV